MRARGASRPCEKACPPPRPSKLAAASRRNSPSLRFSHARRPRAPVSHASPSRGRSCLSLACQPSNRSGPRAGRNKSATPHDRGLAAALIRQRSSHHHSSLRQASDPTGRCGMHAAWHTGAHHVHASTAIRRSEDKAAAFPFRAPLGPRCRLRRPCTVVKNPRLALTAGCRKPLALVAGPSEPPNSTRCNRDLHKTRCFAVFLVVTHLSVHHSSSFNTVNYSRDTRKCRLTAAACPPPPPPAGNAQPQPPSPASSHQPLWLAVAFPPRQTDSSKRPPC